MNGKSTHYNETHISTYVRETQINDVVMSLNVQKFQSVKMCSIKSKQLHIDSSVTAKFTV